MRPVLTIVALLSLTCAGHAQTVMPNIGIQPRLGAPVPRQVTFRDERGETITLDRYFGSRPVILMLGYYGCPRLCSMAFNNLAAGLRQVHYQAGQDFEVVIISIDPRETPQLAAAKKAALGAETWHFLTGDEASIKPVADAVGFGYAYDARRDLYAHASGIMVLTPDGTIARYLLGLDYAPRDLSFSIEDAAAGKTGSPITQPLRLLCYAYDPEAGKYTLMTMRLMRWSAAVMLIVVGIFLARAWRRKPSVEVR